MVVIGFIVASAQIENTDPVFNPVTVLGGFFLLLSIVAGVVTYSASNPDFGPGPQYLSDVVQQGNSEKKERVEAIQSYAYWMFENEGVLRKNGLYLVITQFLLMQIETGQRPRERPPEAENPDEIETPFACTCRPISGERAHEAGVNEQ